MTLATIQIQGKPYVTVNERLKHFRDKHPLFSLSTDLVKVTAEDALIKAVIRDEQGRIIAEGTAYERASSSFINKGSHVENCETSAWGRALGNFGIGIDASVATADEVATAVLNQNTPKAKPKTREESDKCSTGDVVGITKMCQETGTDIKELYKFFNVQGAPTKAQAESMLLSLKKKLSNILDKQAIADSDSSSVSF